MATTQIRGNTQIISGTITDTQISAAAAISTSKLAQGTNFLQKDGSVVLTANLPAGGFTLTGLATPVNPNDAATMAYVDSVATGLDPKGSVRVATTAAITLSGTQTIDGVALSAGNRVLVKDQGTASTNGIYVVNAGGWTRSTDADSNAEVTAGLFTFVAEGTANADTGWVLTTNDAIVLDTTALTFTQFSGSATFSAGTGLTKTGSTFAIDSTVATLAGTQTLTNKSIDAGQLTGTVVAGRLPAFTGGDVTSSAGSAVLTIGAATVSYAKIQNVTAARLLGNPTGGATSPSEITLGSNLAFSGSSLTLGASVTLQGNTVTGTGSIVLATSPTVTGATLNMSANGANAIYGIRFTDSSPTGNFMRFQNAAASADLWAVDVTGTLTAGTIGTNRLSGTLAAGQFPALTGDVTTSAGNLATTIAANAVTLGKLATLAANSVIGNSTGSTATPTAIPLSSSVVTSSIALRDSLGNILTNNFVPNFTTVATAAGTTTLTSASSFYQQFTGTTTQTVVLPNATTLTIGLTFFIANRSTGVVTVNANGGGLIQTMAAGSTVEVIVTSISTAAGVWDVTYAIGGAAAGTVTTVSVASANGFAGSVTNASTTPAITVSTSITGVLKGNGTAISAASNGTDYVNNANFVVRETPSGSVNSSNVTFTLANTPLSGTEQIYQMGVLLDPGAGNDYTISGGTITMLTAPTTGDKLRATYMK